MFRIYIVQSLIVRIQNSRYVNEMNGFCVLVIKTYVEMFITKIAYFMYLEILIRYWACDRWV